MVNWDTWMIGIANSSINGVRMYRFDGTEQEVKEKLLKLVQKSSKIDEECYDYGTDSIDDVDDVTGLGREFYAYSVFTDYHMEFTAIKLDAIHFV